MKSISIYFLIAVLLCTLAGCAASTTITGASLVSSENVVKVQVSSLPESSETQRTYTSAEKIKAITDHIDNLQLDTKFPENPNDYSGSVWVITYIYADESSLTLYHFGNMFLRTEQSDWTRLTQEQAVKLSYIIAQYASD